MAELSRGIEIERRFIIELPDICALEKMDKYTVSEIVQTYLASEEGTTRRVRKRTTLGTTRYYETVKTRIDKMSVIEDEGEISAEEYEALLPLISEGTRPIIKTRHAFPYNRKTVEIDVYPEWQRSAILEVELSSRDEEIVLPDFIRIIREVTGDRRYSNAGMSREFPIEDAI